MRTALEWLKAFWRGLGKRETGFTEQLDARLAQHGWTAVYVGDYRTAPTWTYTIAETLGAPEVIVFDLPQDTAN